MQMHMAGNKLGKGIYDCNQRFPNCSSVIPLARQRLLAPAMFLPAVVIELLKGIFIKKTFKKKASRSSGKLLYILSFYYTITRRMISLSQ